jgi:hypothetical protein
MTEDGALPMPVDVEQALEPVREALKADDYHLTVLNTDPVLALGIRAGGSACADCLAPPAVLTQVISTALEGRYAPADITIEYPSVPT